MAHIYLLLHPFVENITQNGRYYIANPLFRRLRQLNISFRQVNEYIWMIIIQKLKHLFDSEALVLWNVNSFHQFSRDHLLPAGH